LEEGNVWTMSSSVIRHRRDRCIERSVIACNPASETIRPRKENRYEPGSFEALRGRSFSENEISSGSRVVRNRMWAMLRGRRCRGHFDAENRSQSNLMRSRCGAQSIQVVIETKSRSIPGRNRYQSAIVTRSRPRSILPKEAGEGGSRWIWWVFGLGEIDCEDSVSWVRLRRYG
jgi:hypothetical protein